MRLRIEPFFSLPRSEAKIQYDPVCEVLSMKALVIGATGAVGTEIVQQLLDDNRFTKVDIFVRRHIDFYHPKLTIHTIDFDNPSQWRELVRGDVFYSCLGCIGHEAGN